jgi:hypothetical protein
MAHRKAGALLGLKSFPERETVDRTEGLSGSAGLKY